MIKNNLKSYRPIELKHHGQFDYYSPVKLDKKYALARYCIILEVYEFTIYIPSS